MPWTKPNQVLSLGHVDDCEVPCVPQSPGVLFLSDSWDNKGNEALKIPLATAIT